MLIPPNHEPGRHCGSTGIRDLVRHHGIPFSEAFCFGLGTGLGIWYLAMPGFPASRIIHVRSQDLEHQFFVRMGIAFSWAGSPDPEESHRDLMTALSQGRPALLQTDIRHLPYYGTDTSFPGHVIVAWGFDEEEGAFLVSDTERPGLQNVPFEAMKKARYHKSAMLAMQGNFFAPESLAAPDNLAKITARAIRDQSLAMLKPPFDFGGLSGLRALSRELPEFAGLADAKWCARFGYQVLEKRGTGGGGFRLLYADFLDEAQELCPQVKSLGLASLMREKAEIWTALALRLKDASEQEIPDFTAAGKELARLCTLAERYHTLAAGIEP
ncbi:MAG: BtrH N-terminal domain-containing protein [Thermodesulfobacteriota bacterium]